MKKILSLVVIGTILLALAHGPAFCGDESMPSSPISSAPRTTTDRIHEDPPGELILADVLFLRPAGLVACVVGMVGAFVTWPFAASSNSGDLVGRQLMIKPFRYTFERPLGQLDWEGTSDDTNL